jgi:hypothetical protein
LLTARRDTLTWGGVALAVLVASVAFVAIVGMRPTYDAYGWLVWGHQALHWSLNTDGAPSWKPLTFLFTLPYALFGGAAVKLWMVTSVVGTLAGVVFAARVAHWLTQAGGVPSTRRYAPYAAGAFAAAGLLGMQTYAHLVLITNSDQMIVALCLAVLAALGRPEAWPFAGLYAMWLWWRVPSMRVWLVVGVALIPAFWFSIPAATSRSWLHAGQLAEGQATAIHGNKLVGVIARWRSLYELPMQLAAAAGVVLAAARRDLETVGLAGIALLWVAVEIAFAYHGWSAVSRYLVEPTAVMVVIAGGLVGRLLADSAGWGRPVAWLGPALVLVLVVSLVPVARRRAGVWRTDIVQARQEAKVVERLGGVVARIGGSKRVLACGQPVSGLGFQSTLAWTVGLNVGSVGYHPGRTIRRGKPVVLFKPDREGWQVRLYNLSPRALRRCASLRVDYGTG